MRTRIITYLHYSNHSLAFVFSHHQLEGVCYTSLDFTLLSSSQRVGAHCHSRPSTAATPQYNQDFKRLGADFSNQRTSTNTSISAASPPSWHQQPHIHHMRCTLINQVVAHPHSSTAHPSLPPTSQPPSAISHGPLQSWYL